MKLSIIIPSYKDPYLFKTIEDILNKSELGEDMEVIAVLDGYWVDVWFEDPRVKLIHLGKNVGMREAINYGVSMSSGEFIMRTDEHCMFAKGFDKEMTSSCKSHWIMTPRRYFLDPVRWEVMDHAPVDYEKLKTQKTGKTKKFCGVVWHERTKKRKHKKIDETMAMQGSCWLMKRKWWDKTIKKLQTEGYGPMYQDSHEMVFKTWRAGGKLVVNKNTWFAHKHVSFPRTHQYSRKDFEPCLECFYNDWINYYNKEIKLKWQI